MRIKNIFISLVVLAAFTWTTALVAQRQMNVNDRMPRYNVQTAVEVTGSLVKIEGNDALIAREITKVNEKLVLRDAKGTPLWSRSASR